MLSYQRFFSSGNNLFRIILLSLLCLSANSYAQQFVKKGNIATYRGNKFEFSRPGEKVTEVITDPVTGKKVKKVGTKDPTLIKMNKMKIYNAGDVTIQPGAKNGPLQAFVIKGLADELSKLPDGVYFIDLSNVVIDNKGRIVYYEYGGILSDRNKIKIPADIKTATEKKIDSLVNKAPAYIPGQLNNKAVVVRTDIFYDTYKITVKQHKISITR